jgi:hypothetical protein
MLSDNRPAENNTVTLQTLTEQTPEPPDRKQFPDPENFPFTLFTEVNIDLGSRTFPAGSTGGPDSVRLQHLRHLITNKEQGPALVTSLTAFVNLLMAGKYPHYFHLFFLAADLSPSGKGKRNSNNTH